MKLRPAVSPGVSTPGSKAAPLSFSEPGVMRNPRESSGGGGGGQAYRLAEGDLVIEFEHEAEGELEGEASGPWST
jgi:hypothetical protein